MSPNISRISGNAAQSGREQNQMRGIAATGKINFGHTENDNDPNNHQNHE
jgi:hypothetical protein